MKTFEVNITPEHWGIASLNPEVSKPGIIMLNNVLFNQAFQFSNDKLPIRLAIHLPESLPIDINGKIHHASIKPIFEKAEKVVYPDTIQIKTTKGDIVEGKKEINKDGRSIYIQRDRSDRDTKKDSSVTGKSKSLSKGDNIKPSPYNPISYYNKNVLKR